MKKIKLLYIDDIPTPYRLDIFKSFQLKTDVQFKLWFCAESEPGRTWDLDYGALDYEILNGKQWRPIKQKNPFSFKWNTGIRRKLKEYNPDMVILAGYMHPTMQIAAWWCRRNNIPYGTTCESSFLQSSSKGLKWKIKKYILSPFIKNMSFALPVGQKSEEYLRALGANDQLMYFFPNTPDVSNIIKLSQNKNTFEKELRNEYNIPSKNRIILFAGRFINAKRPQDLLDSFMQIDNKIKNKWSLILVGDGLLKETLIKKASIDSNIVFPGWLPPNILHKLMVLSDIFVLPSIHEPWGAVVNEAMAAATAVIASNSVGAAHELIENYKNGYMFETQNIIQLKSVLSEFMSSKINLLALGENSQKKARDMGHEFAVENLLQAINQIKRRNT